MKKFISTLDGWYFSALIWATSTKKAAYALSAIIVVATAISPPTTLSGWLLLIVSIYYQGVALPGVGYAGKQAEVAAKAEGEATRKLLHKIHSANTRELALIKEEQQSAAQERAEIREDIQLQKDENKKLDVITKDIQEIKQAVAQLEKAVKKDGEVLI